MDVAESPSAESPSPESPTTDPATPTRAPIPLVSTRGLLGAAFDLLLRSSPEMRRASFYIGAIILGTVGPLALGSWGLIVSGMDRSEGEMETLFAQAAGGPFVILVAVALAGLLVATVESRTMAATILGGTMAGRPISTRRALARSRRTFWRAVVASVLVGVILTVAQNGLDLVVGPALAGAEEATLLTSTLLTALIGAPFAYMLAGVVLGDVDPFEALRRSFRIYGVRRMAAVIIVVFETFAALLILFGIGAGLDLVLRLFDALGIGPEADAAGLAVATAGIVAIVFAFGTLLFTVMAVTVAPQVVMFLGLTHASFGLDRVEAGGPDDPEIALPARRRFRWFTMPMLAAFTVSAVALAAMLAAYG